jgi:hypothetical protein
MPEFAVMPVKEARLRTLSGRQRMFMSEYADYIQQLPQGQAGKLHVLEHENPLTIRRRLVSAAQTLGTTLIIKRSGADVYFWRGNGAGEEPRRRGRPRRRQDEPVAEETTAMDQSFIEIE